MQLKFSSVMVDDQERALAFYTQKLGFTKMADIPMGEYRWLTVVSPAGVAGMELVLEPMGFPPARDFQRAMYDAGVPAMALISTDMAADVAKLRSNGVVLRGEPTDVGPVIMVVFEDGCGNLINLAQPKG